MHDRIQLLAVEIQEEKHRLIQILIWVGAIMFLSFLVVVFASLVLVAIYWDTNRVAVVSGLAATYLVALVAVVVAFQRFMRRQSKPFAATLAELKEDRACMQATN